MRTGWSLSGGLMWWATSTWPTVGSTAPPVISAARSASRTASNSSLLTTTSSPGNWLSKASSESSRKFEQLRSNAATVRFTRASAAAKPERSVTDTTAWPPQSGNSARPSVSGAAAVDNYEPPDVTEPPPVEELGGEPPPKLLWPELSEPPP